MIHTTKPLDLAAIRAARDEALATPQENFTFESDRKTVTCAACAFTFGDEHVTGEDRHYTCPCCAEAKMLFIVRDDVPAICAEIESLRTPRTCTVCSAPDSEGNRVDKCDRCYFGEIEALREEVASLNKALEAITDPADVPREKGDAFLRKHIGSEMWNRLWGPDLEKLGDATDAVLGVAQKVEQERDALRERNARLEKVAEAALAFRCATSITVDGVLRLGLAGEALADMYKALAELDAEKKL